MPINLPKQNKPINDLVTNAAAATSHNLDYSTATGTPEIIRFAPKTTKLVVVTDIILYIEDTGDFVPDKMGVDVVLSNGIALGVYDVSHSVLHDLLDGLPLIHNYDFAKFTPDLQISTNSGLKNVLTATFTFRKPIMVNGRVGEYIGLDLDDDFTDLTDFTIVVKGWEAEEVLA